MGEKKQKQLTMSQKIVLVTGASRGIGHGIAQQLAQSGFTVIGTATTAAGADKITEMLQKNNYPGEGMVLDVCDEHSIQTTMGAIQEKYAAPLILVNNAGITRDNILLRMREEQWSQVIETNLTSVFRLTKLCLKPMVKARWGRIINITSVVATMGNPGQANYVAAKAGMIGFTKSIAQEMAAYGITANAVAPGYIATDMTDALNEKQQEAMLAIIPMKKKGSPLDIAYAVDFLASDRAEYITGQTLHVNGGMCMV